MSRASDDYAESLRTPMPPTPDELAAIATRSRRVVEKLSNEFPSRSGLSIRTLWSAAEFLEAEFTAAGFQVESQSYETHAGPVRNLIVEQPGSDPGAPCIILGAHYDTVLDTPGADDNASGVAGVLELTRLLKGTRNRRTIRYVAFAHEEPPYFYTSQMGSRRYAASLKDAGERVMLMFSLEMIGYAADHIKQLYPFPLLRWIGRYPKYGNYVAVVGNLRSLPLTRFVRKSMKRGCTIGVESLNAPGFLPPLFLSDHSSFWRKRYPAVMVTDTAFLRNPHYHRPTDTPDTINYEFLAQVVAGVREAVLALDAK